MPCELIEIVDYKRTSQKKKEEKQLQKVTLNSSKNVIYQGSLHKSTRVV